MIEFNWLLFHLHPLLYACLSDIDELMWSVYVSMQEESKLYIFIELVTQGSLSSLYQKYKLRESQVSAYTRQILNGLVYLHERNVVHRYKAAHHLIFYGDNLMFSML